MRLGDQAAKLVRRGTLATFLCALAIATPALAQDDVPPDMQCLRYIQSQERNLAIPAGLLTAIGLVESGRPADNGQSVIWPWTINVNGQGRFFASKDEAVAETRKLLDEGQRSIDVGCVQVNLRYHPNAFRSLDEAFDPATNVAYGAQFLKSLHDLQGSWPNAVERFHSSEDGRRAEYRDRVLQVWNDQARNLIMDQVMAENTDTPYHQALRDYVAGHYAQALDKYQGIVDASGKDSVGLLGLAMCYEKLSRPTEALQSYARYLAVNPTSESVAAHVIEGALHQPAEKSSQQLQMLVKAGVNRPDVLTALAQVLATLGQNDAALAYARGAAEQAPGVAIYELNAGILADKLNRKAQALAFYNRFLDLYSENPIIIDTSIENVRARMHYLSENL